MAGSGTSPRREAARSRTGRHRRPSDDRFVATNAALEALARSGASVSVSVIDTATGHALLAADDRVVLPVSGAGRVLLLIEVAAQLESGDLHGERLQRMAGDAAAGPGLWQFLQEPTLQIADLATLVGATADAWATNALLSTVGIDAVRRRAEVLGVERAAVIDRVRDLRGPDDAPDSAIASTRELSWLMRGLVLGEVVDQAVSSRVLGWLSLAMDTSLVAASFGIDPLAHRSIDHDLQCVAITGVSDGVRCEAGVLRGPSASLSYAATVRFDDESLRSRLNVIETLRVLGTDFLDIVHAEPRIV